MRLALTLVLLASSAPAALALTQRHEVPEAVRVVSGAYMIWGYNLRHGTYMRDECGVTLTDEEAGATDDGVPLFAMSMDTACVAETFGDRNIPDFKLWTVSDGGGIMLVADPKKPGEGWRFTNTLTVGFEYEHEFADDPNKVLALLRGNPSPSSDAPQP